MSTAMPGYRLRTLLHRGRRFDVYDAWSDERDCPVVVKRVRPGAPAESARRLLREGRRLQRLSHPGLVRAYEVHREPRAAVVLETLPGQTAAMLFDEQGPLTLRDAVEMGRQLVSVTGYLHAHGLVHADVKPGNAIVSGGQIRLLDLSLAQRPGRWRRRAGTPGYLAPEQAALADVTPATDVWGIGLMLLEAASGDDPYPVPCSRYDEIHGPVAPPTPLHRRRRTSRRFSDLVEAMTQLDPAQRPTLPQVRDTLAELVRSSVA